MSLLMVEYLLFPAALLFLLALLAVQFLVTGFAYGPRARRRLWLLAAPAAVGGTAVALALPGRALSRGLAGLPAGVLIYLATAVLAVLGARERKLDALVGDATGLRRELVARQREADRLFWQVHGGSADGSPARPSPAPSAERVADAAAGARRERTRSSRLSEWREELRHTAPEELAARARVLEAARLDVPEGQRDWFDARLAVLWTVYRERSLSQRESADAQERWEASRRDVVRLRERLAELQRRRAALRGRRLPLD